MDKQKPLIPEEEYRFWRQSFSQRLDRIDGRIDDLHDTITEGVKDMKEIATAGFPNNDPVGHRQVHENYIKEAETKEKLRNDLITHALKGLLWAALVFIGTAVWTYFVQQVKS